MMAMIKMLQVIESGLSGGIESIEVTLIFICMADIRYLVISKIEHNAFWYTLHITGSKRF